MLIYVTGPPGAGKSTLCRRLADEFSGTHLSVGDLIRAEIDSNTAMGALIKSIIGDGPLASTESFLPSSVVLALVRHKATNARTPIFLDGYPVNAENFRRGHPLPGLRVVCVLNLRASWTTCETRCLARGRQNETRSVIAKRYHLFLKHTSPVIKELENEFDMFQLNVNTNDSQHIFEKAKCICEQKMKC